MRMFLFVLVVFAAPAFAEEPLPLEISEARARVLEAEAVLVRARGDYAEANAATKPLVGNGYRDMGGYWYKDGKFYYAAGKKSDGTWRYYETTAASGTSYGYTYTRVGDSYVYRQAPLDLAARVEAIEKSLGVDVPSDKAITPAFLKERAIDKEANAVPRRRHKLFHHINNQLDYQFADTRVVEASIADLFVKPKDEALAKVIQEYEAAGWVVEYVPGPKRGNEEAENGHYKFKVKP